MAVTLLNWATSSHVKSLEMAFVLIDERRTDLSDRITGNPYVATIEVPLPSEPERLAFAARRRRARPTDGRARRTTRPSNSPRSAPACRSTICRCSSSRRSTAGQRLDSTLFRETQEAPDRAPVSGSARVHRAEVEARHGHRARGGEAAAARRRGTARARRARLRRRWAI